MLTLVLTLAMLLSVMVVGAGAATFGDQESITNKEAVDVCTTLNIIGGYEDGTFRPTGNVTRAEMSKMICVALNGGQEPTMGSGLIATFNDVAKDHWAAPYIEYCVSQGIVGGVGGGNFNPTGNITGTQAAKMLLCILGYNASIQGYVGSDYWETNINVDAAQKGLYAGLTNLDASAPLTRDQAAQMIWNALNAYEVEYKTTLVAGPDGTLTSKVTVQDKVVGNTNDKITLLEDKYEAKTFVGTFDGNSKVVNTLKDGQIQVTGDINSNGASGPFTANFPYDLDIKYIGEEVKVLYQDKANDGTRYQPDEKDTIYGVYITGNKTVVNAIKDDIDGTYSTAGKVSIDDKSYEVDTNGQVVIDLGAASGSTWANAADGKTAIQALAAVNGDSVKFILNDQNKIDRVYVTTTTLNKVTAVSGSKVSVSGIGTIDTAENDTTVYSGVAKDDIVAVTKLYDSDVDDATFVIEKAQTVTGTVTGFSGTPNKTITMDGTVYKVYNEAAMSTIVDDYKTAMDSDCLDNEFTLYLVNGYVCAAQEGEDSMNNYAIVVETNPGGILDSTFNRAEAKLLLADGTEVVATLHKDSTIYKTNKVDGTANIPSTPTDADKSKNLSDLQTKQIVKYSVMSNGQYKIEETGVYASTGGTTTLYNKDTKAFNGVVTDGNCVLFYTNASGDLKAANIRNLNTISVVSGKVYASVEDSNGKVVAAFIDTQARPSGAASDTLYGIITSDGTTTTYQGDTYIMFNVWTGEDTTVYVDGDNAGATALAKGKLVSFDKSSDDTYTQDSSGTKDFTILDGSATAAGVVAPVTEYNATDKTITVANALKSENGAYVAATKSTYALDDDVQIVYIDADNNKAGNDSGTVDTFDGVTGFANVLMVFDENSLTKKVVAIIVNTNSDVNVLGETAVTGANAVTAPADVTANDLTAKVTTDKATAVAGETVTVTVKLTGTANAESTIAASGVTPTANSYTGPSGVAGVTLTPATGVVVANTTDLGTAGYTFTYTFTMGSSAAAPTVTIS